jgi:peptide/nickel transport system ATP-binding protein
MFEVGRVNERNGTAMEPLLKVEKLTKRYERQGVGSRGEAVLVLDCISFAISAGTTLALVGESGSGKSTLALCLACLERPTSGGIWFEGRDLASLGDQELRRIRPHVQMIFQDPAAALNPRWSVAEIVAEPLLVQGRGSRREREARAIAMLEQAGLAAELATRRPSELSGGQRQRVAIARALVLAPKLLILDEVLSALDCSVQAQIVNLLLELQGSLGLTYLFITHDLAMAAHVGDEIAVLERGRLVEHGSVTQIMQEPQHAATRNLLASTPRMTASGAVAQGL